jgi:energy-coupling factor transporter ATP-binding protein EcfA2
MDQSLRYSFDAVKDDNETELLRKLKLSWGYDVSSEKPFTVVGRLRKVEGKSFGFISELRSAVNFEPIEYPIALDRSGRDVDTVFIHGKQIDSIISKINEEDWIIAHVGLSPKIEREKWQNPFALVVIGNVDVLKEIPSEIDGDYHFGDKLYVEKSVVDFYIQKNRDDIESAKNLDREKIENDYLELKKEIDSKSMDLRSSIDKILNEKASLESQVENQLENKKYLESRINSLKISVDNKNIELNELENVYKKRKGQMESNLSRLNEFVKTTAERLSKLDLVSESDLKKLLGNQEKQDEHSSYVNFNDDLSGDLDRAVKYIQSFLHKRGIYYKQGLIKDFFALLRTNDLIILAGDSGSGKTNLVKSMADAIGGKSIVIPVKPNWTSSEDLLGYYNPLEKKFLSTPFLDALIEASQHPDTPYFICLDEMNLARVEYYFADFLSLLEDRSELPNIYLYSDAEADHALSEFKTFLKLIDEAKSLTGKIDIEDYIGLLKDQEVNQAINKICGFNSGDSLLKYHSHLRRILSGFLNTPSSIKFPKNVRIIGAINVDETTHYLSPKILDRAHVIRFGSPLLYDWSVIEDEIEEFENLESPLRFDIRDLGVRVEYPGFDRSNQFARLIMDITEKFLNKLGVEMGFRTVRQALNYRRELSQFESNEDVILNNFVLHKILPKLMFDGEKISGEVQKKDVLEAFRNHMEAILSDLEGLPEVDYCIEELNRVIENAKANNWVVNYWSK